MTDYQRGYMDAMKNVGVIGAAYLNSSILAREKYASACMKNLLEWSRHEIMRSEKTDFSTRPEVQFAQETK